MIPHQEPEDIKIPKDCHPVITCIPADPKRWEKAGLLHVDIPKSYQKGKCAKCDEEVYIGPKQRTFIDLHPEVEVQCFDCTMALVISTGNFGMAALNNQESCTFITKKGRIMARPNPNN